MKFALSPVGVLPIERYVTLLGEHRLREVSSRVAQLRARLTGRVVWNVSSTSSGGGVAEMVRSLLAYARGAGVEARWVIMEGSPEFFHITKRIHNAIHGSPGDSSPLGPAEHRVYERIARESCDEIAPMVRPRDVVIIHDPQPAAMIPALLGRGAHVIWRCHIGGDQLDAETERGWSFLAPYLQHASAYVFSRAAYVPPQIDAARATIIAPSIDPFSAKNQPLSEEAVREILVHTGIVAGASTAADLCLFVREDGTPGRVDRFADVVRMGSPPSLDTPLVVQVSRWDRLKDPIGVMDGFARMKSAAAMRAQLVLAGPRVSAVADDPEDCKVYGAVVDAWRALPDAARLRVNVVALPTADIDENAAIVNALQRHAAVIVQKSLHEGFGLTVAEAMWKGRPVVASAVGGIQDQIDDGIQGLLLRDPCDLDAFAALVERALDDGDLDRRLGENGHQRVLERYLGLDSLLHYGALIEKLDDDAEVTHVGARVA